ncbi:glycosyltransferase [Caenispirillum bisanense]|uniref:glycosyltransferase n=1 Tax=Caenispirillum bisanense TaxID=414052 RepID=UPI0031DCA287
MTDPAAPAPAAPPEVPGRDRPVLLAWEMGEGLAHASRLLMIATRLRAAGWRPVVAARNPAALAERYAAAGVPVVAAPVHQSCYDGPGPFRAATFADVMGVCGYADRDRLAAMVAAWDAVLDAHRPAVVIADYSPLLSLACCGRVPLIPVGDGFVVPPGLPDGRFPPLGDEQPPVWPPDRLLDHARAVQAARGLARPESLPQIMLGIGPVMAVPPELEIYADHRPPEDAAAGPWDRPPPPLPPPPAASPPRVFAYLRLNHGPARVMLQALLNARIGGEAFLHGATPQQVAALGRGGIRVHAVAPPLREALAPASLLIHHGGIGSTEDAALAGRPQLLLPRHLEQKLNTRRALAALPGVFSAPAAIALEALTQQLPPLLANARAQAAARAAAGQLTARTGTAWQALQRRLAMV